MKSFWRSVRLTTCGAAILVIGFGGAAPSSPAHGQEKTSTDRKANESIDKVRQAAEQGDANAQAMLGDMYYQGQRVPQDYAEAARWLRQAAEQGDAKAQFGLGILYYKGQGVQQDHAEAVRWYRKAADQGNANAQCYLGSLYAVGQGVTQDYAGALRWYRKAADQGNAECQETLGYMYEKGVGVPRDYAEAVRWYRKAADQGNASAQYRLGEIYQQGQGVPQDFVGAARWYRKAADQGDAYAQNRLGFMYDQGQGVPQDHGEAVRWFRKAADQGNADGQCNLGVMYAKGQGLPQDHGEAVRWFRKAADQGNARAQYSLSSMYYQGQGVPQDYSEAARWCRKAADQGNAAAQKVLGYMYDRGEGVPQDHGEAALWFRKATVGSAPVPARPPANWRSRVGPLLTPDQIDSLLSMANLPSGLYLQDSQQAFGNAVNDLNNQNPWLRAGNHTGFAVWLYEPKAWLGAKKEIVTRRFQTYREEDVPEDDRFQVLRIIVRPDTPEYLTAWGAANATNVDHVVLRSIDKAQVAQPVSLEPTTEEFWSALGGRAVFAGLFAIFSMADVERIRSASPSREFLVTIIGARKKSNRDFRVKQRFFARLGD